MLDLILRGARLDGDLVDVAVSGGRIERVAPGIEGSAAMASLLVGLVMTWLFLYGLISPLQGVAARAMNGLDLSWLAGMLSAGLLYYALYKLGFVTRAGVSRGTAEPSQTGRTEA